MTQEEFTLRSDAELKGVHYILASAIVTAAQHGYLSSSYERTLDKIHELVDDFRLVNQALKSHVHFF